ncbi:MAG: hypothetical protein AVDCRST_MAG96-592 [uncultured Segetibacter sp.]|uniref:Uncharacterized protein n=1 Tax=uncultured Segetibacter sp. TaxID=481133 RepID=A0A6J4RI05_9BACT|nr:MAG: hypothetical protein AVDCRST_MAG96-592 [uncultured Segetibacter sp.]
MSEQFRPYQAFSEASLPYFNEDKVKITVTKGQFLAIQED